jgi:hypothetical protein
LNFDVRNKRRVKYIFVEFRHGNDKFIKPMRGIKDNEINKNVLGGFIIMHMDNIRQPSLQPLITIPNKRNALGERFEVKIGKQESFKSLILQHPMLIPRKRATIGIPPTLSS